MINDFTDILRRMDEHDKTYRLFINLLVVLANKDIINWRDLEFIKNNEPEDIINEQSDNIRN